jgi:GTP 3',8-cyclase
MTDNRRITRETHFVTGSQRMDLRVPVDELSKSGIVEEVQAFKDVEVRRLTSQYGTAA